MCIRDSDSNVTHIIRGDDHLSNAAKQKLIYQAMDWRIPIFAHIPLIFGEDGKKLSKRHGATGTTEYQKLGYTPAGMRNYLARLGWSHGDDEFFTTKQAISWFNLKAINKSPARFDFKKLDNINSKHIAISNDEELTKNIIEYNAINDKYQLSELQISKIKKSLYCLKDKSKKIRVFANVCRHRSAKLLEGKGNTSGIICPFHSWSYNLEGRLKGAPNMDDAKSFKKDEILLKEFHSEVRLGLCFVHFENNLEQNLDEQIDNFENIHSKWPMETLVSTRERTFNVNCNWKAFLEVFNEYYHLNNVHPTSIDTVSYTHLTLPTKA